MPSAASKIRMRLGIMQTKGFTARITLKGRSGEVFDANVEDFRYDENDTKVVLRRPESAELEVVYLKKIASVERVAQ